jgi:hypothetical protein
VLTHSREPPLRLLIAAALAGAVAVTPPSAAAQLVPDSMVRTVRTADMAAGIALRVANTASHDVQVVVEFADWEVDDDGAHRFHPPGTLPGSCGTGVTAAPAARRIAGDEAAAFTIVHADVPVRGCRVMVWFRTDDMPLPGEDGIAFVVRTGVKLHIQPGP